MAPPITLVCRSCGAPIEQLEERGELRCSACGTATPLNEQVARNLHAHRARVARGVQLARAIVRARIMASQLATTSKRTALVFLVLVIACALLTMLPIVAVLVSFGDRQLSFGASALLVVGLLVGTVVSVVLFLGIPAAVTWRLMVRDVRRFSRLARRFTPHVQAHAVGQCGNCGARSTALTMDMGEPVPCPYCGASLAPPEGTRDAVQATLAAINAGARQQAVAEMTALMEDITHRPYKAKKIPGTSFEYSAGLATGSHDGVTMWAADDFSEGGYFFRLEADHRTNLGGAVWFLPRPCATLHGAVASELELDVPRTPAAAGAELDGRMLVLVSGRVNLARLLAEPSFRQVLTRLSDDESLLLDGAGLSLIRTGTYWTLTRSGGLPRFLRDNVPWVAWLVRALSTV